MCKLLFFFFFVTLRDLAGLEDWPLDIGMLGMCIAFSEVW